MGILGPVEKPKLFNWTPPFQLLRTTPLSSYEAGGPTIVNTINRSPWISRISLLKALRGQPAG